MVVDQSLQSLRSRGWGQQQWKLCRVLGLIPGRRKWALNCTCRLTGSQWRFWRWRHAFECLVRLGFHLLPTRVILRKMTADHSFVLFCFSDVSVNVFSAKLQQQSDLTGRNDRRHNVSLATWNNGEGYCKKLNTRWIRPTCRPTTQFMSSCMTPKCSREKHSYRRDDEELLYCKELNTYMETFSICR